MKKVCRSGFRFFGYELSKVNRDHEQNGCPDGAKSEAPGPAIVSYPPDFSESESSLVRRVQPFTMTSPERIVSLLRAVHYVLDNSIEGDIVECGVWKGGSMMAIALSLLERRSRDRDLYLFDTFEGMSAASDVDISIAGDDAGKLMAATNKSEDDYLWAYSPLDKVRSAVYSTGYPQDKIHFIKGKVEDTLPEHAPKKISLLRLDTDWYESTKHELIHLFPRLSIGGVLIIDDYGHWQGAKKAVDEYIQNKNIRILLNRIDYTGRIAVKQ